MIKYIQFVQSNGVKERPAHIILEIAAGAQWLLLHQGCSACCLSETALLAGDALVDLAERSHTCLALKHFVPAKPPSDVT